MNCLLGVQPPRTGRAAVFDRKMLIVQAARRVLNMTLSYAFLEQIRDFVCLAVYYSGLGFVWSRLSGEHGGSVLVYHSIDGEGIFPDSIVRKENFEQQIEFLSKNFSLVTVVQMAERLRNGEEIPPDWAAITFDDGYKDLYSIVLPLLERYQVPFSVYVTSGVLDDQMEFFVDRIYRYVSACKGDGVSILIDGERHKFKFRTKRQRRDVMLRIALLIRSWPEERRERFLSALADQCGEIERTERQYLSRNELREISNSAEAGAHSVTHANLTALEPERLDYELTQSRRELKSVSDGEVQGFAYPFGKPWAFNDQVIDSLRRAGYRYAVTTVWGKVSAATDVYAIPRIGVANSLVRLKLALLGVKI